MLTEIAVRDLKPEAQRFMKADRDGLYVEVVPSGIKYWWFVSQVGGKRKEVLAWEISRLVAEGGARGLRAEETRGRRRAWARRARCSF